MQTHELLQKYFQKKKQSSPGYSLRVLSRQMDLSPSFLSRLLSGKKPLPYGTLLKFGKCLDIEPELFHKIKSAHLASTEVEQIPRRGHAQVQTPVEEWDLVRKTEFAALRRWYYLSILEFTTLPEFDGSTAQVAERLKMSVPVATQAMKDLAEWGLLTEHDGRLRKRTPKLRWTSASSIEDIRIFHAEMLERALTELKSKTSQKDFERRLITGITLTAPEAKIQWAKERLAECLHEIANELSQNEGETSDEVYHLSAQLFPMTSR